jgi:hypothetical protein
MVSFNHSNADKIVHGINSHPFTLLMENKINPLLNKCLRFINTQIEERYFDKSGLSLDKVLYLTLNIFKVKDYRGSLFKQLPFKTQSVINVQNNDNKCFLWSILAAKYPVQNHANRVSSYKKCEYIYKINSFPVHIDIKKLRKKTDKDK